MLHNGRYGVKVFLRTSVYQDHKAGGALSTHCLWCIRIGSAPSCFFKDVIVGSIF